MLKCAKKKLAYYYSNVLLYLLFEKLKRVSSRSKTLVTGILQ
jgi:hypothetical protein